MESVRSANKAVCRANKGETMETKAGAAQGWRNAVDRDRQAAIELQNDEGFKAVVKIADDLVRD